jgi:hypothetical protein
MVGPWSLSYHQWLALLYVKTSELNDVAIFQLTGRNLGSPSNRNGLDVGLAGHEFSENGACCIRTMC